MTTTTEELLSQARDALEPCPHCGLLHTPKLTTGQELAEEGEDDPGPWVHSDSWAVICDMSRPNGPGGCGASGGFYPSEAEAIEAWNRRAAIDAHLKQPSAPAWPCHCDERGIGQPGVTCGDCPRDYGHTVAQPSAPSGEPADLMGEARHAITALLSLIRRNAPELSGKTLGYAEAVAAKIATAQAAPAPLPVAEKLDAEAEGKRRCYESTGDPQYLHEYGAYRHAARIVREQAAPAPQAAFADPEGMPWLLTAETAMRIGNEHRVRVGTVQAIAKAVQALHDAQPAPAQAEHAPTVQPLTEAQILAVLPDAVRLPPGWRDFARAIERAHGITATTAKG